VADQIDLSPGGLLEGRGARREVTVLVLNILELNQLSESLPPADVVRFLVGVFNQVSEPVFEAEGAVDKFIGGAMVAVFGFPVRHDDDPARAIATAERIQRILEQYNAQRQRWSLAPLGVGIGIHTGPVITGNVGCDRKLDYTVMGEAVDVAFRLVRQATAGQILISPRTYTHVRDRVKVRPTNRGALAPDPEPVEALEMLVPDI